MSSEPLIEVRLDASVVARLVKWKVKPGCRVSHGTIFALYDDDPVDSDKDGGLESNKNCDKLKRLKANLVGKVKELLISEGGVVRKGDVLLTVLGCAHPVVMKNMCAECGADLLESKQVKQSMASVAMVHSIPELVVSQEQAQLIGRADEERLIKSRKLVLLVDLDQTLVHTTNDDIPNNLKGVHHFQMSGGHSKWYHVRIRPGTQDFLEAVGKLYELHICTFGARFYAHVIAKFLDKDGRYFSHRILSRDECFSANSKMPNLKALFPCGDQMVCIIDDREDVWNYLPNVVKVKPYHFFQHTGDINAPSGLAKTERDDDGTYVVGSEMNKKLVNSSAESVDAEKNSIESPDAQPCLSESKVNNEISSLKDESIKADIGETIPEDKFLSTVDENNKPEVITDLVDVNDDDDYLLYLTDILEKIHASFYDAYDHMQKVGAKGIPNLRDIIPLTKRSVLRGVRIVFSGVVPTNVAVEKSHAYKMAVSLGAEIQPRLIKSRHHRGEFIERKKSEENESKKIDKCEANESGQNESNYMKGGEIKTGENITKKDTEIETKGSADIETAKPDRTHSTTHLVAARLGTVKVSEARRMHNVHIVTPDWLWCCASRWDQVEERLFPLTKTSQQSRDSKANKERPSTETIREPIQTPSRVPVSCGKSQADIYPTYDPITGKRINKTNLNGKPSDLNKDLYKNDIKGISSNDGGECSSGEMRRPPKENFVESINPLMSFGSADIASMDQEVDDFLDSPENDDDSISDDDEDENERIKKLVLHPENDCNSSSSNEYLSDDCPKSHSDKRKRSMEEGIEITSSKYQRGEILKGSDRSESPSSNGDSDESAESIGSVDDEMADAVERQLLEL